MPVPSQTRTLSFFFGGGGGGGLRRDVRLVRPFFVFAVVWVADFDDRRDRLGADVRVAMIRKIPAELTRIACHTPNGGHNVAAASS
jgi:hypothetical protein